MAGAHAAPESSSVVPVWRRVSELADLVEIFEPGVQVCTWPRELDPAIGTELDDKQHQPELQAVERLSVTDRPKLSSLPIASGHAALADDLSLLREIVCELLGCPSVGLRLARVGHAMCPGWHVDRVGLRLVCTYQGPGTEWLADQGADRGGLRSRQLEEAALIQAIPGEIVLLKGASWPGNEALGAVHRSPTLPPDALLRTLVTLDPLW